jgi:arsenate reductase (thioredoxin)
MTDVPEVLFVCAHNTGRSQMAAALPGHQAAGRVRVTSAGSQSADQLNPAVVAAMAEIGLDISREFPKPLTSDKVQAADIVIIMGCGDACPIYPGKRYLDWDLPNPAGLTVDQVRPIRDEIERRVRGLLDELDGSPIVDVQRQSSWPLVPMLPIAAHPRGRAGSVKSRRSAEPTPRS